MKILERLRDLLTDDADPPGSERIREVREDAASRMEDLREELQQVDERREEALLAGDAEVDALEERREEIEREVDRLEVVHARLGERLDRALRRERREETERQMAELPDQIERLRRSRSELEDARSRIHDLLKQIIQAAAHLKRRADLDIRFSPATFRALEGVQDDIPGTWHSLEKLAPPPEEAPDAEPVVVYEVQKGRRVFRGPWTKEELRDAGFNSIQHEGALPDVHIPEEEQSERRSR